jgi:hypothetical protein
MDSLQSVEEKKIRLAELRHIVCNDTSISAHILEKHIEEIRQLTTSIKTIEKEVASHDQSTDHIQ